MPLKLTFPAPSFTLIVAGTLLLGFGHSGAAQELQPRAYLPAPVGTGFGGIAYGNVSGSLLFDPTLPVEDLHVNANILTANAGGYWSTFGRTSQGLAILPYVRADLTGTVAGTSQFRYKSGLADSAFRYSVDLIGAPAMSRSEFASYRQKMILGVSLTAQAPTGQYDPKVLVNIGTNRWAFKPEVALSTARGRWTYEAGFGAWLFSPNRDFAGGISRTQSPLWSTQAHVVRLVPRQHWVAFDTTYFAGATTRVDGEKTSTNESNLRLGATFGYFLSRGQAIRFSYFTTVLARIGGDTRAFGVAYQFLWARGH